MTTPTVAQAHATLLGNAAATLTPAPLVRQGEPSIVGAPMVAFWFAGFPVWEANTMSYTQRISRWGIRLYYPMTPTLEPASSDVVEAWLEAAVIAIEGQYWGHVGLMGAATGGGAILGEAKTGWQRDMNGDDNRTVEWEHDAFLANVSPIAT